MKLETNDNRKLNYAYSQFVDVHMFL